ncbi:Transmembrane protease serine 9-like Protein [Tribolium castaneum]|uniref:Transmembrane protease serine 9-like Protein n=2 Tax=Tribolium castaneum TaxID=7070 RepID=A0A139WI55_TRICA|nr:Transmembrane protease serine 9-like Protein [Tribolium castaneum]
MKNNSIHFLCFVLMASATSATTPKSKNLISRIIGGSNAYAGQFPFAAAINVQTSDSKFFCVGTLLTNQWILTAGHCVNNAKLFTIQVGSNTLKGEDPNRVVVATSDYVLHPEFNSATLENNIGLIKLRLPVEFTNYVQTVQHLPSAPLQVGISVMALGWGQVNDENSDLANDLKWVIVTSISNNECKLTYGNQITDRMVCVAGNYNEGPCIGDSGGPIIHVVSRGQMVLVGVSSFVSGNGCESTDPSGYTRVYPYLDRGLKIRTIKQAISLRSESSIMKLLFLVFCYFISLISGQNPGLRIIGGDIARASQFPYSAGIISNYPTGSFFCGGALISNQWILTAAQCIINATQLTIYLGSNKIDGNDPNRVTVATATYVTHPDYNPDTLENDVGLVRLRLPVEFNEYISAINLPLVGLEDAAVVTAIGWGQESDHNPGLVSDLHFVEQVSISNEECKKLYGSQIVDSMVCVVGQDIEGICTGDSGGPLVAYRNERSAVHVAVASFYSSTGCESVYPSGYTRTYPYVDWITSVTGITP